ncbi:tRNA(Ile)-lysidine synthetase [Fonsecaea erecta]|uniref:tRNA(Ile)-lysidine synthetase n=1 Tax=Fonsecaea erecta TaxID=1367422 RepID=A0A178ZBS7_9EURO|nr:tRNA(Ile)-lysidine synthetase [Fonsecaea erecta]OAP57240.1 tRNA(Ile)-lysidine synthetase [Fonsecaea erecta]
MALAYLLNQLGTVYEMHKISVQPFAFIVNHNARKESTEEANYVHSQLCQLGVESKILEIQWPNTNDPASTTDFELKARRARYRLIADAAIQREINHLFLGHHQDDQVETVLMRLVRNSGTSFLGLQGMSQYSTIPCCEDIRGANEVKEYTNSTQWLHLVGSQVNRETVSSNAINYGKNVTPSAPGGLRIYRPLLPFPKSAIIDFCNTNRIPHVQDTTNYDPTLTLRNAVRYMRSHYVLPKALQGPSILELRQSSCRSVASLVARGEQILQGLRVLAFDLRSGRMTVQVLSAFVSSCESDPEAGAFALARLTSVVSPQSRDDGQTLVPRHNLEQFLDKNRSHSQERVTIQQVLLEKVDTKLNASKQSCTFSPKIKRQSDFGRNSADEGGTVWTLSRPPMRLTELTLTTRGFSPRPRPSRVGNEGANLTARAKLTKKHRQAELWSEWILWDHRYWVRVRTENAKALSQVHIRAYTESDVQRVHARLLNTSSELQSILAEAGPVSVFPTLNITVDKGDPMTVHPIQEWEICYKVIDHRFINQKREMIEWRNAQVNPRNPVNSSVRYIAERAEKSTANSKQR